MKISGILIRLCCVSALAAGTRKAERRRASRGRDEEVNLKKAWKLIAVLLVFCMTAALLPPMGFTAGEEEPPAGDFIDLRDALNQSEDEDTIHLNGKIGWVNDDSSTDAPWVVDKNVTIEGGTLSYRAGGIVLGKNVTLRNIKLNATSGICNEIMANGYTLTLDNVTCESTAKPVSLFCGSLAGYQNKNVVLPKAGPKGTIRIEGSTDLSGSSSGNGNIYAGNLILSGNWDGTPGELTGNVEIAIPSTSVTTNALGTIYACGAMRDNSVITQNTDHCPIAGTVTISGKVPNVEGDGSDATNVVFNGGENANLTRKLTAISKLTVAQGTLALTNDSSFRNDGAALSVASGATLNIKDLINPAIDSFQGGGSLVLGKTQRLNISGGVSGKTIVGIGQILQSSDVPEVDHTYITAPQSAPDSFELAPLKTIQKMHLERGEDGSWTAREGEASSHTHSWSAEWTDDAAHHWHECAALGCPVTANSGKDGYAAHTPGDWIIDRQPTETAPGSRYKSCTACGRETAREEIPATGGLQPSEHIHAWNKAWTSDAAHHWHECTVAGCPVTDNSGKDGYAAHTPGDWVIDRQPTAAVPGSRHKPCTACGRETAREEIPATGGGSSGGGFVPPPSGAGGSIKPSAPVTEKHPDGSTTTTAQNTQTGTLTVTTKRPDGSQTVVETSRDGAVTTTETTADGSSVITVEKPDGSKQISVKQADGTTAKTSVSGSGRIEAVVNLSAQAVDSAQRGGTAVLPVPQMSARNGAAVTVHTGSDTPVKVEILAVGVSSGTVAVIVHADGSETVVKTSVPTENGIAAAVPDRAVVCLRDNGKHFPDTGGHWAEDAVAFVSARELFAGDDGGVFAPDAPMTRAMLMTVLARLDGVKTGGGADWYQAGLDWAAANGISDGANPEALVTREQLAAMLYRFAGSPAVSGGVTTFGDNAAVSGYALDAVRWAVEKGILTGYEDGSLQPGGKATRAQLAVMLMRYITVQ